MLKLVSRLAGTVLLVCSAALTSCASAPPSSIRFDPASQEALMVMVLPTTGIGRRFTLRSVNLETGEFGDAHYSVNASVWGGVNRINDDPGIDLRVRAIPPGTYALVDYGTISSTGVSEVTEYFCYFTGAPVWEIRRGGIAVMPMLVQPSFLGVPGALRMADRAQSDADILAELAEARTQYAGLNGEAEITYPVTYIRWEQTHGGFWQSMNRVCAEPANFSEISRPGQPGALRRLPKPD